MTTTFLERPSQQHGRLSELQMASAQLTEPRHCIA
jgi:hypothetical protein